MNAKAIRVLKALLKKGWISRAEDYTLWNDLEDAEVMDELETLKTELEFAILRVGSRAYLIPDQENELFSQNNMDFRRDIKAQNDCKVMDLYLLNYLAMYLLYEFFHGEGSEPLTRDFILKDDFISQFSKHCNQACSADLDEHGHRIYGINFRKLAEQWLSKTYGEADSRAFTTQNGCLNRILVKMKTEGLFFSEEEKIVPAQKCKDLMPYFLRKDRTQAIHTFLERGVGDAADQ